MKITVNVQEPALGPCKTGHTVVDLVFCSTHTWTPSIWGHSCCPPVPCSLLTFFSTSAFSCLLSCSCPRVLPTNKQIVTAVNIRQRALMMPSVHHQVQTTTGRKCWVWSNTGSLLCMLPSNTLKPATSGHEMQNIEGSMFHLWTINNICTLGHSPTDSFTLRVTPTKNLDL